MPQPKERILPFVLLGVQLEADGPVVLQILETEQQAEDAVKMLQNQGYSDLTADIYRARKVKSWGANSLAHVEAKPRPAKQKGLLDADPKHRPR